MSARIDRPTRPSADTGAYGVEENGSHRITPAPEARRNHKTPLAWLPWAALAAIAALVLLSLLVINAVDDDGAEGPAGDSLGQVSGSDGAGINGQDGSGSEGGEGQAAAPAPQAPALKVGEQDLLGLASSGGLGGVVGQPVTGTGTVESVVSDEGFWVGSSPTDRVFVFLTPQARQSSGESGFQVKAGQTVELTGSTVGIDQAPEAVGGVAPNEGLDQLRQQGSFVRADAVKLAG